MLRDTYHTLSEFYLLEARSCYECKAYRMAVVAAATSVHLALYYTLIVDGVFNQDDKLKGFHETCEEYKKRSRGKTEDIEYLKEARNALAHPEEWLIAESTYIPNKNNIALYEARLKTKFDPPKTKAKIYNASEMNNLRVLKEIAEKSIMIAETVFRREFGMVKTGTVLDWKKEYERLLGFDMEKLP